MTTPDLIFSLLVLAGLLLPAVLAWIANPPLPLRDGSRKRRRARNPKIQMTSNHHAERGAAVGWSAWSGVMVEWVKWWGWRRWRIYCRTGDVSHLFERPDFQRSLVDYDEAFVSPCTLNEINCGGHYGQWTPKIALIGLEPDERMNDE